MYNETMGVPFEAFVGLRYVRAKRRSYFISFISLIAMAGIALGIVALITVMSVMNGFEKELTSRVLGMASHADVAPVGDSPAPWRPLAQALLRHEEVIGAAPYFRAEAMLARGRKAQGARVRGVLPDYEPQVSSVGEKMRDGQLAALQPGANGIILGAELARSLGVAVGDRLAVITPQPYDLAGAGPASLLPGLKRFTVVGVFAAGMSEFDSGLALMRLEDALALFKKDRPAGLRLKTADVMEAPRISREALGAVPEACPTCQVMDWTQRHANLFKALKTEKAAMFIILTLTVAVAAFNIVSTLVLAVRDKRADIAVLRAMGATSYSVMKIFIVQGLVIGLAGLAAGVGGGVWLAANIDVIVPALEAWLQVKFMPPEVYYISELPSELRWRDVAATGGLAFLFTVAATLYPAWRAAQAQPAQALRHE